jgi:hypothetical protein
VPVSSVLPACSSIQKEQQVVEVTDRIDETFQQLDNRLDLVLEKHETDFLAAYRYHMLKV